MEKITTFECTAAIISDKFSIISSITPLQIIFFLHNYDNELQSALNGIINRIIQNHTVLFQEQAWELLIHKPWQQVHRNTDRSLANARKHESGVQRLKVAQIFTTQSTIQNLHLLYYTLHSHLPAEAFLNGAVRAVMLQHFYCETCASETMTSKE